MYLYVPTYVCVSLTFLLNYKKLAKCQQKLHQGRMFYFPQDLEDNEANSMICKYLLVRSDKFLKFHYSHEFENHAIRCI